MPSTAFPFLHLPNKMFRFVAPKCQAAAVAVCAANVRYSSGKSVTETPKPKQETDRPEGDRAPVRLPFCL